MTARPCALPRCSRIHFCRSDCSSVLRCCREAEGDFTSAFAPVLAFAVLQEAGCSLVTVHGRQRDRALHHAPANWQARTQSRREPEEDE